MPKRARPPSSPPSLLRFAKRSCSSTSPSHRAPRLARLPLTTERLALHDSLAENQPMSALIPAMPPPSMTTGAASSRSASPSKSSDKAFVDELKASANSSLDAVRSPNARQVVQRQRRAQRLAEQDGIDLLKGVLLVIEDDDLPMLAVMAKQNLDKGYLPPPIDLAWVKEYGPQSDHVYGCRH
ncbi:hypothetical protein IQ07DRAFT_606647, partial [Pyrenochaeta sp. DS3sAY3a]